MELLSPYPSFFLITSPGIPLTIYSNSDGDNISDGSELLAIKAEESPDTEVEGPKPKQPRTTKEMKAARDAKVAQFLATEAANPVNKKLPYKKTGKGGWAMNTEREVEDKGDAI